MNGLGYIRRKCNVTTSELAQLLDVSSTDIDEWEDGRKEIPVSRYHELSKIFGIDEAFFGEVSPEQLIEIDNMPVYVSREKGKDAYRFNQVEGWKKSLCPSSGTKSLNELHAEVRQYRDKLLKEIETRLSFEDQIYPYDEISMIKKMAFFYEALNELIDCYGVQKGYLKVGMRYEIKSVLDAMLLAFGITDETRLYELDAWDGVEKEDTTFIRNLAKQIKEHWEEKNAFREYCREGGLWIEKEFEREDSINKRLRYV